MRARLSSSRPHSPPAQPAASADDAQRGQSLVEMALLLPLLLILFMGIIEFALAFNATLGINRASQDAALVASEAGNAPGADCLILNSIEGDVTAPNDKRKILEVQIQRTSPSAGSVYSYSAYSRSGSTTCTLSDGTTVTIPYSLTASGYPISQRCNVLSGCPGMTPARTSVDNIAVQIKYQYTWQTPLSGLLDIIDGHGPKGTTYTFAKRNAFRMEPQL